MRTITYNLLASVMDMRDKEVDPVRRQALSDALDTMLRQAQERDRIEKEMAAQRKAVWS